MAEQIPQGSQLQLADAGDELVARAIFVGERIDDRSTQPRLGEQPVLTTIREGGWASIFRYGAVVFFAVPDAGQERFLRHLAGGIEGSFDDPEHERVRIVVDPSQREGVYRGDIVVGEISVEHLQLVSEILAKSVVLAHYEEEVADVFHKIEPLATGLSERAATGSRRRLMERIGETLLIQHRMVGRVEVSEKPELLWERADLERLYLRMEDEFELGDRHSALERKLGLISKTNETLLEMLHTRQGLRLEWYIVVLIVIEILLYSYDLFVR